MAHPQIEEVEANLLRLNDRLPGVPVDAILLCRLIMFLAHDIASMLDHHIRPFGIAEGEFRVLTTLFSQPDGVGHPSDLCARATQSPANMSRICDALVSRDLITRVPSARDRRRMVLRITESGEELVRNLLPTLFQPMRELFAGFSGADHKQLIAQLKGLAATLEAALAPSAAEPAV